MKDIFNNIDNSLILYWENHSLKKDDFYCRSCGNLMLDINQIYNLKYDLVKNDFYYETISCKFKKVSKRYGFIENEINRWLVKGRTLSGKTYFRHLCWDCFFKQLRENVDIQRRARKGKWYAKLATGKNIIPAASMSPSLAVFKLLFDITDEELGKERIKFATATLESKIMRFGKDEGTRKWKEYCARQSYTCSKEYMMKEKGMTEEEWNQFNANRASTKENFIKRYGENEGTRRWNNYCAYESYAGSSLMWFINKYGEEEGKQKYNEICLKKESSKSYSYVSQTLFKSIDEKLGDFAIKSRWEQKNHEYEIIAPSDIFFIKNHIDEINNIDITVGMNLIPIFEKENIKMIKMRPDYLLNKHIIEFNGDFWHANPSIYKPEEVLERFNKTYDIAKDIWERDKHRLSILESLGFKVLVVWESEYAEDPDSVVDKCIKFLSDEF